MTLKIFIGNLNSDTTSDKLRPLFEKYGEVAECDVLKNFGFVHMTNKNDANKAIAQLDGYSIDGNNIRVELSTGKKGSGGGGGGKFDKKGFMGGPRSRPYGPPPPRDPREFDRYPYPPMPPMYDRYDPYYRYYIEREAYYARLAPLPGERNYPSAGARDRFPPPPRERLADRYPPPPDPRDRLPPPRSFLEDRSRALGPDPYFRERDPIAARPPPEYYDRKPPLGGRGGAEPIGAAGAAGGRGGSGFGGGDFYRGLDRPGANMGGAAGGLGGAGNGPDFLGRQGGQNSYGRQSGPVGGVGSSLGSFNNLMR